MSYTIKAALDALDPISEEDFLLFVVADQPYLTADTLEKILGYAHPGTETVSAAYQGVPGNPTMFSAHLGPELLALEGDDGGRKVIRSVDMPVSTLMRQKRRKCTISIHQSVFEPPPSFRRS